MRKAAGFLLLLILVSCGGLRTQKERLIPIDEKVSQGAFLQAASMAEKGRDDFYQKKDRVLFYLDTGMLYHYAGEYEKSNQALSRAETAIEELYTESISRAALSMVANDNVMEYAGEPYEDIYLNVFKALNYMHLGKPESAFVEIRRMNEKLRVLEDKNEKKAESIQAAKDVKGKVEVGRNPFHNSALGRYLSLLMYRTEGNLDNARLDAKFLREAFASQGGLYDFPMPDVDTLLTPTSQTWVTFIVFTGKSPDKTANTLWIHTEKDLIIVAASEENPRGRQQLEDLNVIPWEGVEAGIHVKFQVPELERRGSKVRSVRVLVDGQIALQLQRIESLENVAVETYKLKEPWILLKTVARVVGKAVLSAQADKKIEKEVKNDLLGFGLRMLKNVAIDATENADLRISRYFPAKALVGELIVEPGVHDFSVEYLGDNDILLYRKELGQREVRPGKLNLVESYYLE